MFINFDEIVTGKNACFPDIGQTRMSVVPIDRQECLSSHCRLIFKFRG